MIRVRLCIRGRWRRIRASCAAAAQNFADEARARGYKAIVGIGL